MFAEYSNDVRVAYENERTNILGNIGEYCASAIDLEGIDVEVRNLAIFGTTFSF